MKKLLATLVLMVLIAQVSGQNRMKFKYMLSQKKLDNFGFALVNFNTTIGKYGDTLKIDSLSKLKAIIKLDSKGNILVDFWQITDTTKNLNSKTIVNSRTNFNLDNLPKLSDKRTSIGKPTKFLWIPFKCLTFGAALIPFRYRWKEEISSTEKVNATVTSPKPDISFTGGWTMGTSYISNRSIISYSSTFGGFVGLSSTEIKDGLVKSGTFLYGTSKNTKQVQTNPTVSYGGSITIARNNLGIVLAGGFDHCFGRYNEDWIYQNKFWFGIGLSANLGIF